MVFPSSKYHEPLWQKIFEPMITTRVLLMRSPFYDVTLPVLPFYMGYPEGMLSFARHTNLCIYNSERYMFLELSLFSCIMISVYHLIVKSMSCIHAHRYLLFLWSVKPFYSGMTRRKQTPEPHPYLGLDQSNCIPQIKMPIQLLLCSTLKCYHLIVKNVMRIAPPLMNS